MTEDDFYDGLRDALATEEEIDEIMRKLALRKPHVFGDVVDRGDTPANEPR